MSVDVDGADGDKFYHNFADCRNRLSVTRGVATGGISVYIPPKSVTVLFTCGTLTRVLKLQ